MTPQADGPGHDGSAANPSSWLADYSQRLAQTFDDSVRASLTTADRWARRSLSDQEWSIDTVTADAIADWEELTPLLGRWLDLWLEAAQRPCKEASPDGRA
jgi:hypothetical protein